MFTPAARLRHTFSELEAAMAALSDLITQAADTAPVNACCFPLPDVASGDEHEPVTHIEVARLDGAAAITATLDGYRQWFIRPGCSTKASFRLPGYLVLPATLKPELQALTEDINRLKGEFKAQVQEAESRDQKFALVHDTLPGLITLQVYRQLVLLPHPVSRLGFTWANKQIIQKIDKDKLVKQLTDARLSPPPLTDAQTWLQCVDREIYDVKRLPPGVELRLRRPVKTHPMVNVRWREDISPRQQQVKAHLPLLLCQDELPAVTALGNYPPATTRKRRAARITDEPLIPRLHIYPYRPDNTKP
ncbi:DNA replication terminus site-binding protein [Oceanisphaera psychrotolerans]|uniref:DNA replication terminus site-binding protein n=1 Tax=Oceanisphaera psychrotolerans TaxID=1414654 RepID=A0A1J4QCG5_9GAMM|nr:DNA replication terminus site-binding protein [Oceanisphaera psychrotolerans]OIN06211.1 DNA replication terminus site-binding protein [Oceanisphaera psychrotolerans]